MYLGSGKTSLAMSLALKNGIIKCISTDTIRLVMRLHSNDDAVNRSSYSVAKSGEQDAVANWLETCAVLDAGVMGILDDSISRGNSVILEGVHLVPNNTLLEYWKQKGGVAKGIVLSIPDEVLHRDILSQRSNNRIDKSRRHLNSFDRIRTIQREMISVARTHSWEVLEQEKLTTLSLTEDERVSTGEPD